MTTFYISWFLFSLILKIFLFDRFIGYGFVDFDSPAAALKAVHALKTSGIQAQMAKVRHAGIQTYFIFTCMGILYICTVVCVCVCVYVVLFILLRV